MIPLVDVKAQYAPFIPELQERFAEVLDLGAEDEAARLEHLGEALLQLGDERRVLRLDVDERDHDARSLLAGLDRLVGGRPATTPEQAASQQRSEHDDGERDDVVDEAEGVVERLPARARGPAGSREGEAPDAEPRSVSQT